MEDALIASNIALWIAVVVLAVIVLALLRQIGVLHERVAPAGALMGTEGPRVGEAAAIVPVVTWAGRPISLGAPNPEGASTLLFFVSPTCPVCKELLPAVDSMRRNEGNALRVILASDGPRAEHESFVFEHRLDPDRYVLSSALGIAYQVGRLPYAILVDPSGVVRARGLVNTREHLESLLEAGERGVASLQDYLDKRDEDQRVA